jgi:hypothetical protein
MVAKLLKDVEVTFNSDQRYINTMVVREAGGDTTTLSFSGTRVNEPVATQIWEMPPHDR